MGNPSSDPESQCLHDVGRKVGGWNRDQGRISDASLCLTGHC